MVKMISIIPFQEKHQAGIEALLQEINLEFAESIFSNPSKNKAARPQPYWVALEKQQVIGTVGLYLFPKKYGILKSMMLRKSHRGKAQGIAHALLQTALQWAQKHQIPQIYLGTMTQFKAAQKFYRTQGFQSISKEDLPADFIHNPLDEVFFFKSLR